jgi:hypothetical protein
VQRAHYRTTDSARPTRLAAVIFFDEHFSAGAHIRTQERDGLRDQLRGVAVENLGDVPRVVDYWSLVGRIVES